MLESLPSTREPTSVESPEAELGAFQLIVDWAANPNAAPAAEYAKALANLLFADSDDFVAQLSTEERVDDVTIADWKEIVAKNARCTLTADLSKSSTPLGKWELHVTKSDSETVTLEQVKITIAASSGAYAFKDVQWLQAKDLGSTPIPVLAILTKPDGPCIELFNSLVVLASRFGRIESTELFDEKKQHVASWTFSNPSTDAIPIFQSKDASVFVASRESPSTAPDPVCWLIPASPVVSITEPRIQAVSDNWRERLLGALTQADFNEEDLVSLLGELASAPCQISLMPLHAVAGVKFMAPPHDGLISVIAPSKNGVTIGVDFEMQNEDVCRALQHAYGHVVLGHIRPDDEYGHWDTISTITSDLPDRRWDREVRTRCSEWFNRTVSSLEECTSLEKAQLGLWRMIGEMIGESKRLHHLAERYQTAAYQRQAAQRLVAMLEEYGGALLCDGVGLGKTYVATTLMVHYANKWRNENPESGAQDPFRITVLSPNSVVSTWKREAIPPLTSFGVPLSSVRVVSHSKLSRISNNSDILQINGNEKISDLEHLLLSDLVIVDEAHNFRSVSAGRTKVLRDLLRIQPRLDVRRRVALLTATPINNSLEDLRQQASLLFSRPLWLSDARKPEVYSRQTAKEIEERCKKARSLRRTNLEVSGLVIHGDTEAKFSDSIEFREDLEFGPNVKRIGDYLREQDKKLKALQNEIRAMARRSTGVNGSLSEPKRIAEELLDRIVVQRSRTLCKQIEREQGSSTELLFRPEQSAPQKLLYSDEYDGIQDVLARFLPLFDATTESDRHHGSATPLTLKVYMWHDVKEGIKSTTESSSVVGLQRILVLKRLESSPVSFLITLLRLLVLHAHRLQQLHNLCNEVRDEMRAKILQHDLDRLLGKQTDEDLEKIRVLATGDQRSEPSRFELLKTLSKSYMSTQGAADTDDPPPRQLSLFGDEEEDISKIEFLERLWNLREPLLQDLETLFTVTPRLADIIFGRFEKTEWPRGFISGGVEDSDWPTSPAWGLRLVKDAKLRSLVRCLLKARRQGRKIIVFTQFSDTIAYIQSVIRATKNFARDEWQIVTPGLGIEDLKDGEISDLLNSISTVTGSTEYRDDVVNSFAPYYRINPYRPIAKDAGENEQKQLLDEWSQSWTLAIQNPRNVLISTDVLAEGVNLQDVSMMINFDVHWNPVRMIQRAGRIDRRLNPTIEKTRLFPELTSLAKTLNKPVPKYYFHDHPEEAPVTVNMILPDELEAELQLRERIATKTLAIDFTLGLEQGTGAEADWMEAYKYQGISALNSIQKDRAIEQIASHHDRLSKLFGLRGVKTEWSDNLNAWMRQKGTTAGAPLIGRAMLGRRGGALEPFSKYLEPTVVDGVPYWFYAEGIPGDSKFDGWLAIDGRAENFPPKPRRDIQWNENVSSPVKASHLLAAAELLLADSCSLEILPPTEIGRPLQQGASALAAPKLGTEEDRELIAIRDFFILQLDSFAVKNLSAKFLRQGIRKSCPQCGHHPGFHKCCSKCGTTANGEQEIEIIFGFRVISRSEEDAKEIPQPWCRQCRSSGDAGMASRLSMEQSDVD